MVESQKVQLEIKHLQLPSHQIHIQLLMMLMVVIHLPKQHKVLYMIHLIRWLLQQEKVIHLLAGIVDQLKLLMEHGIIQVIKH